MKNIERLIIFRLVIDAGANHVQRGVDFFTKVSALQRDNRDNPPAMAAADWPTADA